MNANHSHPGSSETEERRSNDWRDPSGLVGRPGEPEQADLKSARGELTVEADD